MIYLDNAATTKPDCECLSRAEKFNNELYFNPSALYHGGLSCSKEIKEAKDVVLKNLYASEFNVTFTSCGSESDNLAIFGVVKRGGFLTTLGEHSAVYKSFLELKNRGQDVYFASLNADGSVNTDDLYNIIKNNKINFVSIVHVNNETGAINDVNEIAKNIKSINKNIVVHVDGVQAYGKIRYRLSSDIDLYSISAHKINALKGVGALIHKKNLTISPIIFGGGQENGLRSGTENVFGIKVFQYASEKRFLTIKNDFDYVKELNDLARSMLDKNSFKIISSNNASPYILSISAMGLRGEVVMHSLEVEGVIVGNGSACSSKNRYSRVLESCGYSSEVLDGVVRISFSPKTTKDEVIFAINKLNEIVNKLKGIMS